METGALGRSFVDGDLEVRFTPRPQRNAGAASARRTLFRRVRNRRYRCDEVVTDVGPGVFCCRRAHRARIEDHLRFRVWVIFYGRRNGAAQMMPPEGADPTPRCTCTLIRRPKPNITVIIALPP